MQKFRGKQDVLVVCLMRKQEITVLKVIKTLWILFLIPILHSTQRSSQYQHYKQSYCDNLSKMSRMVKEQTILEQLALIVLKISSSTAVTTFNNCSILTTNNNDNSV